MNWIGGLVVAALSVGASAVVFALTANFESQPEYPRLATETMRLLGAFIATLGAVFGLVLFCYAVLDLLSAAFW